jgi:signal transduction histidine kinase
MSLSPASFSLQRTLAVRFSVTMFAGLLGLALWGYLGVRNTLMQQLDRSLQSSAQLQVDNLVAHGSLAIHERTDLDRFIQLVNRFVALRDSAGRILTGNITFAESLPLDATALQQAHRGRRLFVTQQWQGHGFRSIYLPAPRMDGSAGKVVQVGASLSPIEGSLKDVLLPMVGTVLLVSLATAIGAGWLAASAVRPVHRITAQARAITGEVAGGRITADAEVREFHGLTEVLNAMVARLEAAAQWHRRIIRDLGHDLRTPITAMRAGVEVALWGERSPDDYRRILASTLEEIDRLTLICDALVLLGRLQAGEVKLDFAEMDARQLVRTVVAGALEGGGRNQIIVVTPQEPALISADARLMRMTLEQLLDNARRYTPEGSRIEVTIAVKNGEVLITVEDDGPGLADDVLLHLFEPFYRSDSARAREGGPGLGLTATASIVGLHGGTVEAGRSSLGGLRVTVMLPRLSRSSPTLPVMLPRAAGSPVASRQPAG